MSIEDLQLENIQKELNTINENLKDMVCYMAIIAQLLAKQQIKNIETKEYKENKQVKSNSMLDNIVCFQPPTPTGKENNSNIV
jgi:NTP pyrophosphatase (non-canonical NTP hydrolase)